MEEFSRINIDIEPLFIRPENSSPFYTNFIQLAHDHVSTGNLILRYFYVDPANIEKVAKGKTKEELKNKTITTKELCGGVTIISTHTATSLMDMLARALGYEIKPKS
jgi:hypothetical protein